MINSTAIRTAISELLEGTIGSVRHMITSEYLSVDANDFASWTPTGCSVNSNVAYGANGEFTADSIVATATDTIVVDFGTIPDNTEIDASVYASVASGTGTMYISILCKDGSYDTSSAFTVTTDRQKFEHTGVDILSGGTTPQFGILFSTSDTFYLSEAHVTADDYLFAKKEPWDGAIIKSYIDSPANKLILNTRYDVQFPNEAQHSASPVSAIGSFRVDELDVVITLYYDLASNIQESERNTARERVMYNGDRIMQALHYPNNLDQTSASVATGIISGMLTNLTHDIEYENFAEDPPKIMSTIRGKAYLQITQLTS